MEKINVEEVILHNNDELRKTSLRKQINEYAWNNYAFSHRKGIIVSERLIKILKSKALIPGFIGVGALLQVLTHEPVISISVPSISLIAYGIVTAGVNSKFGKNDEYWYNYHEYEARNNALSRRENIFLIMNDYLKRGNAALREALEFIDSIGIDYSFNSFLSDDVIRNDKYAPMVISEMADKEDDVRLEIKKGYAKEIEDAIDGETRIDLLSLELPELIELRDEVSLEHGIQKVNKPTIDNMG